MDVWAWICELPNSASQWAESDSPRVFELATQTDRSIRLRAGVEEDSSAVTFTLYLHGFGDVSSEKTLWVSDACSLSSDKPFLPFVLQLLQETISRSPTAHDSTSPRCPRSQLEKLKGEVVSWIMDSHSEESFSGFFAVALLTRLFWLCAFDAPAEAGSLFFRGSLGPALRSGLLSATPALRTFFSTAGADAELCFTRSASYMLAKWCLLSDPPHPALTFSHAAESHGFWTLKGYAPVPAMTLASGSASGPGDLVLKYVLAHQQLEAVIQLEYSVRFFEGFVLVNARVDNLRLHVARLGYGNKEVGEEGAGKEEFGEESHFPSRVKVWVGPEVGANYVAGLSLGRSTLNAETETETETERERGGSKSQKAKSKTRRRRRRWRMDQEAEGNAAVFEAVLCDPTTGREAAAGGGEGFRGRYGAAERAFTKRGGVVMAGDEYGEGVGWRLTKDMEGSVLKWRIGARVWVTYSPNLVNSSLFETRCVEWCDEVDLPLIPSKLLTF